MAVWPCTPDGSSTGGRSYLLGSQVRMLKQAFTQVGKVSVGVSRRRHALVDLHHMQALPRDLLACQGTQHEPRGVSSADGQDEAVEATDKPRAGAIVGQPSKARWSRTGSLSPWR